MNYEGRGTKFEGRNFGGTDIDVKSPHRSLCGPMTRIINCHVSFMTSFGPF